MSKTTIHILDRLINKPVALQADLTWFNLQPKDLIVYKDKEGKEMVGTYLGYKTSVDKKGTFLYPLNWSELDVFNQYQVTATDLYETFKKDFSEAFPTSKPITARMNLQWNQVYFYFYAETRYNFAEFVKSFRQKIGYKFFLYQVGSRDRVRMHPHLEEWYDPSGLPLTYHIFKHSLPNVEGETVAVQQLWGRNNDRLRDWSGKLDHTLNFEKEFYEEESKKYPQHGQIITIYDKKMKCTGYNILTWEIKLRGKGDDETSRYRNGEFKKITLEEYQKATTSKDKDMAKPNMTKKDKTKTVTTTPAPKMSTAKIKTSKTKTKKVS